MATTQNLIFSLLSDYSPKHLSPTIEILEQDERFVQALRKVKNQFDRRYDLILGKAVSI
ncbi:MAG: hypothetical protein JO327_04330 [Nitrososphaeraceae archaeon]|nr:hypothetical protein [Nitrososphaeraceae archaeon]